MNDLIAAAKAVIDELSSGMPHDGVSEEAEDALRAAVEQAESQEAVGFDAWWESAGCGGYWNAHAAWMAAQQAERERIRSRVQIAAEKNWKAGDWYIGPQHNNIEAFVEELLRDDDEQP